MTDAFWQSPDHRAKLAVSLELLPSHIPDTDIRISVQHEQLYMNATCLLSSISYAIYCQHSPPSTHY